MKACDQAIIVKISTMNSNNQYAQSQPKEHVPLMPQYHKTPEQSVSFMFRLRPEELQ